MYIQESMNRLNDSEQNRLREWDARYRKSQMEQEVKKQQEKAKADAIREQREQSASLIKRMGGNEQIQDIIRKGGRMPDPRTKESRDNMDRYYQQQDEMKKNLAGASSQREKDKIKNWVFRPKFTPELYSS